MNCFARLAALVVLASALPLSAGQPPVPTDGGRVLNVKVTPLELDGGTYSGVSLKGAWRLDSRDNDFGGLSGLLVEGQTVTMVTDQGNWITGRREGDTIASSMMLRPMVDSDGLLAGKSGSDAEGLARRGGRLIVSFEQDHRIAAHVGKARLGRTVRDRRFEALSGNGGLEALATLPDGRLIAIGEEPDAGGFPVVVVDVNGGVTLGRLPVRSRHRVTGADIGPDGHLYLLQRHFTMLTGVSIRLLRYRLGKDSLPDAQTAETLAAWESSSGIDNMEGVATFSDGEDQPITIWLVSDDNFNFVQRTILVALTVD